MRNINRYIVIIGILIFLQLSGCSKFEDINTNQDQTSDVSASMLCTKVILDVTKFNSEAKALITESAVAKYIGYANEGQMDEQYYKLNHTGFGGMTMLPNAEKMIEYADGLLAENSYKGVAKFARAYLFYNITMKVGDIPYSEANLGGEGVYKPKYDLQEEVFVGILNELSEAADYFALDEADGQVFDGDPTPYGGDPAKWRRAVNSFALKVLMTLSEKTSVTSLEISNRFAQIVSDGHILEPSTGFYGLIYSSTNRHPLTATNDLFTSKTVISSLLIDNLKNLNDRRMYYFSDPSVEQITNGLTESEPGAYVGVDVDENYDVMNANHSAGVYSLINSRYRILDNPEPRMLITYGEQQLILAEASILGWIGGSAQTYYEQGVQSALAEFVTQDASYAHGMAIDQAYIDGYFTGEAAFKATTQEQLEQIWMQRYIINFMQDAHSSFFEYRRNNYPDFPVDPATSLNANSLSAVPMRWLYPEGENTYNQENYIEALNRQYDGYDEINKIMWLLQ
ncbi:MAG: SusD/RagB family nutrient-binding outer membrane lipoprotein [Bacteroidales bacterium]|nr:SusD/RagB family nutrient-binding outer membrane lipoprotein [Bacteroidales bacterium]